MVYQVRKDLKQVLADKQLTTADLGRRAGVSYSHVSAILNGRVAPSERIALAIAQALDVQAADIFPDVVAA